MKKIKKSEWKTSFGLNTQEKVKIKVFDFHQKHNKNCEDSKSNLK